MAHFVYELILNMFLEIAFYGCSYMHIVVYECANKITDLFDFARQRCRIDLDEAYH